MIVRMMTAAAMAAGLIAPWGTAGEARTGLQAGKVMRELQPPDGYTSTHSPELLSNGGHAVGMASDARGEQHTHVRWEPGGSVVRLGGLGSQWMDPRAIADDGVIAGHASTADDKVHAVTWDASGTPKRLEEPAGYLESWADDINNQHVTVGTATLYHDIWAVRWDRDGRVTFLERPQGAIGSHATGINDSGEIIGGARFGSGLGTAVRWDATGKVKYLGIDPSRSGAVDINNRGTIAGSAFDPTTNSWRAARALRCCVFRVMPGSSADSTLFDVNNRDVFLGSHRRADGWSDMVRWENDRMVVLKPVPGTTDIHVAPQLNDSGLAVGSSDGRAAIWDADGNASFLPDE
ncbi:hypothetical protein ACF1E9_30320 [Streptomyces roseolus]|uniref:hypothetical protein n=1 Tax=Streptomyces roseolus TaxID=67358 RepID=UPI003701462D